MQSRLGLKALGLCALMIGVMAMSVSVAQASQWMVNKVDLTGAKVVTGSIEGASAVLLSEINKLKIEVACTTGELVGVELKGSPEGTTNTTGDLKFTGCKVFKNLNPGLEELACTVHSKGQPNGTVLTETGKGLLELNAAKTEGITLIIPNNAGKEFVVLEMLSPTEECVLPSTVKVFGSFAAKDCEGKGETEQVTHLIVEEPTGTKLFVISETAEHIAKIDGSANIKLATGEIWNALAK